MPDMMLPQVAPTPPAAKPARAAEKAPVADTDSTKKQSFTEVLENEVKPSGEGETASEGAVAATDGAPVGGHDARPDGKVLPAAGNPAEPVLAALTFETQKVDAPPVDVDDASVDAVPLVLLQPGLAPVEEPDRLSPAIEPAADARGSRRDWLQAQLVALVNGGRPAERPDVTQTAVAHAVREVLAESEAALQQFEMNRFGQQVRALATTASHPATLEGVVERLTSAVQPSQVTTATPASAPTLVLPQSEARPVLATTTLEAPFRQPGWDQALSERVLWIVNQKFQGAEIKLNPPHLGPIEVRIHMQHDQAQVSFTAQHGVVREALEAALPRLREMFAANGLDLGDVNVSQQSFAEQQRRTDDFDGQGNFRAGSGRGESDDELPMLEQQVTAPGRVGLRGIDLFA